MTIFIFIVCVFTLLNTYIQFSADKNYRSNYRFKSQLKFNNKLHIISNCFLNFKQIKQDIKQSKIFHIILPNIRINKEDNI